MRTPNNWIVAGLAIPALCAAGGLAWNWIAAANEDHRKTPSIEELAKSNALVVEQLSKRALAEDAASEERKKLCLACQLKDPALCGAVGVEVCE